jgi:molecular chaperone GrpE
MGKTNGKSDIKSRALDLEHELPAADTEEAGPATATVPGESDRPESELEKLKAERDALLDRLARSQAEFDNARKRAAREQQEFRDYASAEAIKALLPVIDNFERALSSASSQNSEFQTGIELIYKQLQDVLQKLGVRRLDAQGQPFDPRLHEAIEMVETDAAPDHSVLDELQRGYMLKDRLLRPAMVKVAKNPKH